MKTSRFHIILLLFLTGFALNAFAQENDDRVLLTVAGEDVTVSEFMRVYTKNNLDETPMDRESLEEYLELYINFKLKVKEAEALGMDTVKVFIDELAGYRKQLAEPYFENEEIIEELVKEAYERKKEDIRASHILVRVGPYAMPEDTLKAWEKIMEAYNRIMEGEDFVDVAVDVSEDPYIKDRPDPRSGGVIKGNKGELGYFTVFDMIYPFETVAYNTEVGEVSKPVRTKHGYHLIKVTDRIPAMGEVQVAHLFIKHPDSATAGDSLAIRLKVDSLYQRIQEGEKFEELVKEYSDDKASASRGGMLPKLRINRLVPEFVIAIRNLSDTGQVAEPVLTNYGWHIVKLHEMSGIEPFDEVENEIRKTVEKDVRAEQSREVVLSRIRQAYGFEQNTAALEDFYPVVDSSLYDWKWKLPEDFDNDRVVCKVGEREYTLNDFAEYFGDNQKIGRDENMREYINKTLDDFCDQCCIKYEDMHLEEKYPEFRALVREYRDGILLFELTEEKVWSRAVEDTTGLRDYYDRNKEKYMWGERIDASVFSVSDPEYVDMTLNLIKKGLTDEEILEQINQDTLQVLQVKRRKFSKNENDLIDNIKWEKGISDVIDDGGSKKIVVVHEKLEPMPKTFQEARGFITADYQTYLEDRWIEELRDKYSFTVHEDVLSSIIEEEK